MLFVMTFYMRDGFKDRDRIEMMCNGRRVHRKKEEKATTEIEHGSVEHSSAHFCISKILERGNGTQRNISRLLNIYADDGKHKIILKQGENKMLPYAKYVGVDLS